MAEVQQDVRVTGAHLDPGYQSNHLVTRATTWLPEQPPAPPRSVTMAYSLEFPAPNMEIKAKRFIPLPQSYDHGFKEKTL